jgi:hypothetical protein
MSGASKQNAIKSATSKAVKAAAPKSYSDPYGSFNGATGVYNPNLSATQLDTQNTLNTGINNAVGQLAGQSFDVNSYYNNPFYDSTYDLYSAPVNRQYAQDQQSLSNSLNAKGLTGGSYDAYSHSLQDQNRDYNLNQAQGQARSASANAYQQAFQNNVAGLQGLNQAQAQQTANIYQPFDNYIRYQGAVNPSSTAAASAYINQGNQLAQIPSLAQTAFNNYLNYMNTGANQIKAIGSVI